MADQKHKYTDSQYYAKFEARTADVPDDFEELGYYQRSSLEEIIDNFIIAYVGDDKVLNKVPEYEIAFWAQRGLQEFSYDTLHSDKSIEIELGDSLQFPLPQDFVNYKQISVIGKDGLKKRLYATEGASNPTAIIQGDEYEYTYSEDGSVTTSDQSITIERFQENENESVSAEEYYNNDYNHGNFSYFNARYGAQPSALNQGGGYFIDRNRGIIFFDSTFASTDGTLIVLDYISDGLSNSDDLSKVYVPKMAEDALYAYMLYNLAKLRPATIQVAGLYKKEASAKLRNTKLRLTNLKAEELTRVLRNKAKWIKH